MTVRWTGPDQPQGKSQVADTVTTISPLFLADGARTSAARAG
ncbi:hypothetical protein [Nocardia sp. NPDC051832]